MNSLLNKAQVKKYTLHLAQETRPAAGFTRVSDAFVQRIEFLARYAIAAEIHRHPSKGVTIR